MLKVESSLNQLYILLIFLASGSIIGIFFDIFRILRKSFKTSDFVTYIEDVLFWIITGVFILYIIAKYCYGEIRIYMFVSLILGLIFYLLLVSKYFIKINVKIIDIIKLIISKLIAVILYPIKLVFKPISFITINIRKFFASNLKNLTKSLKSVKISEKNRKNLKQKKDFPA